MTKDMNDTSIIYDLMTKIQNYQSSVTLLLLKRVLDPETEQAGFLIPDLLIRTL